MELFEHFPYIYRRKWDLKSLLLVPLWGNVIGNVEMNLLFFKVLGCVGLRGYVSCYITITLIKHMFLTYGHLDSYDFVQKRKKSIGF